MKQLYILSLLVALPVFADQMVSDDLVVTGSLGVGLDSVNGQDYGFDTIRLKENNTRIKFDDTSNSGSFPNNDWQLTANDSTNGGQNKFSIDDITSGRTPFTVQAGAPSDALYVKSDGNLGLGTASPAKDIHIISEDSPSIRFDQVTSGGLPSQVWDLIGNEWGFSIQDMTQTPVAPFTIAPGSAKESLVVGVNGVGVGTKTPAAKLHVQDNMDNRVALIESTSETNGTRTLLQLKNEGPARFEISNTTTSGTASAWAFTVNDAGSLVISNGTNSLLTLGHDGSLIIVGTNGVQTLELDAVGNLDVPGSVSQGSDQNRKEDIVDADADALLEKLSVVPMKTWRFSGEDVTHIGPMAQDFYHAFSVGATERRIATVDADGVALASIQALHKQANIRKRQIAELQETNKMLEERLGKLERLLIDQ
jgi:hypothetical protein